MKDLSWGDDSLSAGQQFPAFYETQNFNTVSTEARQLTLS